MSSTLDGVRAPAPVRPPRSQNLVLAVILTSQLMVVLDATIVNVALPSMQRALDFSPAGLSWVLNAYTLSFGGLLLLGARAGDLLGRRRTFLAGIGVFAVASLLGGLAPTSGTLLAARVLQGVGAALAAPSSLALLTTMFPGGKERMRSLALFTAVSVSGGAIGLVLGGLLVQVASWRWVMFVNVPIGIAVAVGAVLVLEETPARRGRLDLLGALTSTLGTGSLVYAFVEAATDGWTGARTLTAFAASAVLLPAFVAVELRAEQPVFPLRLLRDVSRTTANVARGLLFAGMFGMFFFLSQYLQEVLGYGSLRTGLAFLPLPVTVFITSQVVSRRLSGAVSGKLLMLGGIGLAAVAFVLASRLTGGASYPHVLLCLVMFALGNGLSFVPLTSAALDGVPPQDAGAASGLVNVTQQLGGALGVAVLVTVAAAAAPDGASPRAALLVGATHAFAGASLFLLAAFVAVVVAVRDPQPVSPAALAATEA